jgi:NADPH2:quinone reductase
VKAISIAAPGGPEVLQIVELADPRPEADEVTIDVAYAGVGLVDTLFRRGALPVPLPIVPGIEVSGHVRELGANVHHLKVGQAIAALLNDFVNLPGCGGYAQIARARAALTVPVPDGCDLADAASVLVNGTTAWMALRDIGRVKPGERLLILGATGGLGGSIAKIARTMAVGPIVGMIGSAASRKAAQALSYDHVTTPDDLARTLKTTGPIDAVFDTVGGEPRRQAFDHLAPRGRLVILGNATGEDRSFSGDQIWLGTKTVGGLSVGGIAHIAPDVIASTANDVLGWVASRTLAAKPARILALEDAPEAHRLLEARKVAGKIVLEVRN